MIIKTKYLGEVEIDKEKIISFPKGILGFHNHKEFVILDIQKNNYFKFLQDIHNQYVAFLIINPWSFYKDYDIEVADEKLMDIKINPKEDNQIAVYNIVTLGSSLSNSTVNLLAPIVINIKDRLGKQFILDDSPYSTKHRLPIAGEDTC
ncbi:MAG TPA: flagellar assembly protein FliW [Tissierellaceae bacterium]|nr:flagellar assembly protein FliW [Tissierellaceae bacterium]